MRGTFIVRVEKTPGVLLRVLSLFHRLVLDVEELRYSPTEEANVSCMRIILKTEATAVSRIDAHLQKIVEVISVE
jgi:acetolactate synthase I/III small subunit